MFIVEHYPFVKQATTINSEARRECDNIMEKIYKESPDFWPYGLDRLGHDDLYLIREASTGKAVGFTGWQERQEGNIKVGYYSIGVLPAYRGNGYAKTAVSKLIAAKAANVDKVQAFIVPHNKPSHELAASLDIPVVHKTASAITGKSLAGGLAAGAASAGLWDYLQHPDSKYPFQGADDRWRIGNGLLNAALVGGPAMVKNWPLMMAGFAVAPTKDFVVKSFPALNKLGPTLDAVRENAEHSAQAPDNSGKILAAIAGLGGVGLLGGGLLARRILKNQQAQENRGRVKVRLPTRDPYDQETTVEMPIGDARIPSNLYESLGRDTRRKLREEARERTWRRGEKNHLITHTEAGGGDIPNDEEDLTTVPKRRKKATVQELEALVNQLF